MGNQHHRGGLVGPVLLVGLGFILLAQNLGWVQADIWLSLLRLWPLILIAAGIDLLVPRRSAWGTLLSLVLVVAVFVGGFWLAGPGQRTRPVGEMNRISVPLVAASEADIHFSPPVASLKIGALQGSTALLEGTVPAERYGRVDAETRQSGTTTQVDVQASGAYVTPIFGPAEQPWTFALTTKIPINLRVSEGVGEIDLDLTGLQLSGLDVEMGVGRMVITLPAAVSFTGQVSGAIGQTVIVIPEGVAVRVRMTTGIGALETPEGRRSLDLGDKEYTSPGFGTAKYRIELQIEQAIGAVALREG
jgi:hypothetical protein